MTVGFLIRAAAILMAAGLASPAAAAWRRAESANFIVYSQSGEGKLRQQVALLEDYDKFLRAMTGINDPPPPNKLTVYLVRNHAALKSVRNVSETVAGFYTATGYGVAAFADDSADGEGTEGNQILLHEIAHHFMMQYRPIAYPAWYIEGFAEYVMTAKFSKDRIDFGQPSTNRALWLATARWLPLEQVLFGEPVEKPEAVSLYYGESWLLAHYLLRDPARREKLIAYLGATARGEEPRAAFKRIFAQEPKQLQQELNRYAQGKWTYTRLTRQSAAAPPAMQMEVLPPAADDLLILKAAMDMGQADAEGATLLTRVRAAAGKYPDAPFAKRVLAQAEAFYGDGAAADRLLDPLLAAAPQDGELLYLKGMRHLVAARKEGEDETKQRREAQSWFGKAHKAAPNHFQTLMRYVESVSGGPRSLSENTINIILLAHELAPQVSEITMNAASMLLARGDSQLAAGLLMPLASDPHDPSLAAAAKAMLAQAQAKEKEKEKEKEKPPVANAPPKAASASPGKR